jgi:hypothetical protein
MATLLKARVREVSPATQIVLHIEKCNNTTLSNISLTLVN